MKRLALLLLTTSLAACGDNRSPASPGALPSQGVVAVSGASTQAGAVVPDRYIVVFKPAIARSLDATATFSAAVEAKVSHRYESALRGVAVTLTPAELVAMRANPTVEFIEADRVVSLNTTQLGATWGLDRIDQAALPLSTTYSYNVDGTGVTVYIIDTGINFTHTEYFGRATAGAAAKITATKAAKNQLKILLSFITY